MSAAARLRACLENLEPDLRTAAERAARRAGMGLDDWIVLRLGDRAACDGETRPKGERNATILEPGRRRPATEPASDEKPERMPAALGRGGARSRPSPAPLDDLVALRDAVEEIRLALKHPRPARSDPETVQQLRSILAKLDTLEEGRPSRDLSAAARRIEDAAERLGELAQLPREGMADVARQVEDLARCLQAVARRVESREELGSVTRLLEALHARLEERERAGSDLLDRVERLTVQLDRMAQDYEATLARSTERLFEVASAPVPDRSGALESLVERVDARLREAASRDEERLKPIEATLGALVERLGRAGGPAAGAEMLDALERQVSRLARLGEAPTDKEPSVASLQEAMADLLARIAALGDGTIEAVERAAEAAVADALGRLPLQGASDIGSIRDDPEDPRSRVGAADGRVGSILEAVHSTLETVASRLPAPERNVTRTEPAPPVTAGEVLSEMPPDETGPVRLGRGSAPTISASPDEETRSLAAGAADVPPEPGSHRPDVDRQAPSRPGMTDPAVGDIKAGFIAAARRAAQAVSGEAAAANGPGGEAAPATRALSDAEVASARLKSVVEGPRRPLIPGLAGMIPAIGSRLLAGREPGTVAAEPARAKAAAERRQPGTLLPAANEPPPAGEWTDVGSGLKKAAGAGI